MSVNDYDEELFCAIEDLDFDLLANDPQGYGIAMLVVHWGYNSLTLPQRHVYDTRVVPRLEKQAIENKLKRLIGDD